MVYLRRFLYRITLCLMSIQLAIPAWSAEEPHTTIWQGKVWTANSEQPWAEAIAVKENKIVAVGSLEEVQEKVGQDAQVLDVSPGLITPGWIDSHIHLVGAGRNLTSVQLRNAKTRDEFVERIAAFAEKVPRGTWITGGDWDHTLWGDSSASRPLPDRAWIDAVTPNHPVWISRLDGHMALANSAALREVGIDDTFEDVSGGEAVRDSQGRLTGVFKDNAMDVMTREIPAPTAKEQLEAIQAAVAHLVERGVTAVHHMGTWADVEAFQNALQQGQLKVRVYACTPLNEWQKLAERIEQSGRGNDRLRIGGLKGFVDGSLGSHTAAFLEPFSDDPNSRGLLVNPKSDLLKWTRDADKAGLQVMVHAIGDRANRMQLDIYEQVAKENGPRDRRFRIEHAQHIDSNDVPRFAQLEVIASMQPYHIIDDGRWAAGVIGVKRGKNSYPCRSLLDSGARLAFGSDWHVAPPTPIEGIYAAVTRSTLDGKQRGGWTPAERITVEEALRAYTLDAAYAGFQEKELGSLEPGKLADFVVVDRDLTQVPPTALRAGQVLATVVDGETTYESPKFKPTAMNTQQAEIQRRVAIDFNLNEDQILKEIRESIPDVSSADLDRWREAETLDYREIDGEMRYFARAVSNLFRLSKEARDRRTTEPEASKKFPIVDHVADLVEESEQADGPEIHPVKHRIRYELTVPADHPRLRKGAKVACWLPFPQEYRQQGEVKLLGCGPGEGQISPNGKAHRTVYLEHVVDDAEAQLTFWEEFEFVTSAYVPTLDAKDVEPYDTTGSLYREYTSQRPPHIVITPEVAALAKEIVGDETNPLEQTRRIFRWVSANIPWCAEIEYSIIPNLSAKGLAARRGDCGVQGMTFITLCRAAGIPARWQSGWQTKPNDSNIHDWSEFYLEPWGWLPADASYGVKQHEDPRVQDFFCGHMDPYRMIVNLNYAGPLVPPKQSFRSEPNDFQRGEIEIDGRNLYFDEWEATKTILYP
ncbi:N-substituted formamide deformylase precursor [Bythopirellula goksoeyrii]|uniref:N-substituted formamide deformylase n=2 Tax=Bythopirellula goksoeyrii TaxID=1400387 RepID=A0A5B9QHQ3_9BACT|nr:N-substituted formamide deformylase precursor [Bythopirellula goksoeyrii]